MKLVVKIVAVTFIALLSGLSFPRGVAQAHTHQPAAQFCHDTGCQGLLPNDGEFDNILCSHSTDQTEIAGANMVNHSGRIVGYLQVYESPNCDSIWDTVYNLYGSVEISDVFIQQCLTVCINNSYASTQTGYSDNYMYAFYCCQSYWNHVSWDDYSGSEMDLSFYYKD